MAAELQETLGLAPKVTPGGRGVFDVLLDGTLVYSKHETARFPEDGEVTRLIRSRS